MSVFFRSHFVKLFFLLTLLFTAGVSSAQQSALSFLAVDVGTRTAAMGGAPRQFSSDALFSNPARVANADRALITVEHRAWAPDASIEAIGSVVPNAIVDVGMNVIVASDRNIELRDRAGDAGGIFSSLDASFALSAAVDVGENIAVGSTAKFLVRRIYLDEASALLFDVGALYRPKPNLALGLMLANIGRANNLVSGYATEALSLDVASVYDMKNISNEVDMNVAARIAIPMQTKNNSQVPLQPSISGEPLSIDPEKDHTHIYLGAEGVYKERFSLRAGYATGFETVGFTIGVGFRAFDALSLDYAFLPSSTVTRHAFGVSFGL